MTFTHSASSSVTFQRPLHNKVTDLTFGQRMWRSKSQNIGKGGENKPVDFGSDRPFSSINGSHSSYHYSASSRPSTADSSSRPIRSRGSILFQASEVLNSKFGRRRKAASPPPGPIILPGVMEICAPRHDDEVEERERLRDAAAQSIGLGPDILQMQPRAYSIDEVDEDTETAEDDGSRGEITDHSPVMARSIRSGSVSSRLGPTSSISGRQRAGSASYSLTCARTRSTTPAATVPSFPTTPSALKEMTAMAAAFPKHHMPSSLLIFALSKQWKARFIVLSSQAASSGTRAPTSYLHLFKSAGPDEKELERLEINEESVVFVADEEVGGRGGVVKVGGVEIGGYGKEQDDSRTMWLLQIVDPAEAQKWIAAIKTAILGQRSMRAGLGLPALTSTGNEPRGDMDVMLTMRAQGILSSPTPRRGILPEFGGGRSRTPSSIDVPETSRSSPLSMQSHTTTIKSPSSGAVSALKGLFAGSSYARPSSRATTHSQETSDGSFAAMGNNLLGMVQTKGVVDPSMSSSRAVTPRILVPSPIISPSERMEQQRHTDTPSISWAKPADTIHNRQSRGMSLVTMAPLQPPPNRKLSTGQVPRPPSESSGVMYQHTNANDSIAGNFGLGRPSQEDSLTLPSTSPTPTATSFGSPEPRAASSHSASSTASIDGVQNRWSRPVLSQRLTTPNGPRPAPSTRDSWTSSEGRPTSWLQSQHPYARDRSSSQSSNNSPLSAVSGPQSSTKRESNSSVSTASTSHSRFSMSRQGKSNRRSVPPPPRPAPNFALPAPPSEASLSPAVTPRSAKASFRDSVAQRAIRISLSTPKPPPSSGLPPRPDEKGFRHRRSTSSGNSPPSMNLPSISASSDMSPPSPPTPISRHTSLKQRLRILSAPSSTPSIRSLTTTIQNIRSSTPPISNVDPYVSQPSTPIAERITLNPNFLYFPEPIPVPVPVPVPVARPASPERLPQPEIFPGSPEIASLSPPPRRGSRQINALERQRLLQVTQDTHEKPKKDNSVVMRSPLTSSVTSLIAAA